MNQEKLNSFANSNNFKVYGQVRAGEDAKRKKTSLKSENIFTRQLGSAAKLALVGGVIFYTTTVGYHAYQSMKTAIEKRNQAIEQIFQDEQPQAKAQIDVKALKGNLGR